MRKESADWLTGLSRRWVSHFQTKEYMDIMEKSINERLKNFQIEGLTLKQAPRVAYIGTLAMEEKDNIQLLIPVQYDGEVSVRLKWKYNISVDFSLWFIHARIMVSWPSNSDNIELRVDDEFECDFDININIWKLKIPLTKTPFIGETIKGLVDLMIARRVIVIGSNDV